MDFHQFTNLIPGWHVQMNASETPVAWHEPSFKHGALKHWISTTYMWRVDSFIKERSSMTPRFFTNVVTEMTSPALYDQSTAFAIFPEKKTKLFSSKMIWFQKYLDIMINILLTSLQKMTKSQSLNDHLTYYCRLGDHLTPYALL